MPATPSRAFSAGVRLVSDASAGPAVFLALLGRSCTKPTESETPDKARHAVPPRPRAVALAVPPAAPPGVALAVLLGRRRAHRGRPAVRADPPGDRLDARRLHRDIPAHPAHHPAHPGRQRPV